MKSFTVGANDVQMRLSRFVESVTNRLPSSLLYKSFRNGRIKVNGKKAKPDYRLQPGDKIDLYIVDEFFENVPQKKAPVLRKVPFQVVFEDENLLIVHKPAGVLCHSDNTGDPCLVEGITRYLTEKGDYDPAAQNTFAPAVCNRLDRGTQGLVIAAKNAAALRSVNRLIREDGITKTYLCLAFGRCPDGIYEAWHFHRPDAKTVQLSRRPRTDRASGQSYKPIRTGVHLLRYAGEIGLYRITLYTGRTHQIRAHMRLLGHPLLGDRKYGDPAVNERWPMKNQALCAAGLRFADDIDDPLLLPYAGKKISNPYCTLEALFAELTGQPTDAADAQPSEART